MKRKTVAKKPTRKKTAKIAVNAKSRATKKAPSERLKKRRTKNTVDGFYPNPIKTVVFLRKGSGLKYYWCGVNGWNSDINLSINVPANKRATVSKEAQKAFKSLPAGWSLYIDTLKKK